MIERCGNCGEFYCWGDCCVIAKAKHLTDVPDPSAAREMNRIMRDQRPFSATPKDETPDTKDSSHG